MEDSTPVGSPALPHERDRRVHDATTGEGSTPPRAGAPALDRGRAGSLPPGLAGPGGRERVDFAGRRQDTAARVTCDQPQLRSEEETERDRNDEPAVSGRTGDRAAASLRLDCGDARACPPDDESLVLMLPARAGAHGQDRGHNRRAGGRRVAADRRVASRGWHQRRRGGCPVVLRPAGPSSSEPPGGVAGGVV